MRTVLLATTFVCAMVQTAVGWAQSPVDVIKGFVVDQNGNLGVGTNAPREVLHVAGNSMTDGVIRGGGINGQFGTAAVISGFDTRYGQRPFVLVYDGTGTAQADIQIHAINPVDPNQSVFKTFIINHPQHDERYLVHASLEGPEGGIYYRGSAQLENGQARVTLPVYFEALAREDGRTIQLTNVDGFDRLAVKTQDGAKIAEGAFVVVSEDPGSAQHFDWEVKAVRSDGPPLEVEPLKSDIAVSGFGPYTYQAAPARLPGSCSEGGR